MTIRTAIVNGTECGEVYRNRGVWFWDGPKDAVSYVNKTLEDVRAAIATEFGVSQRDVKLQERVR